MQKAIIRKKISILTLILCFVLGAVFIVWSLKHKTSQNIEKYQVGHIEAKKQLENKEKNDEDLLINNEKEIEEKDLNLFDAVQSKDQKDKIEKGPENDTSLVDKKEPSPNLIKVEDDTSLADIKNPNKPDSKPLRKEVSQSEKKTSDGIHKGPVANEIDVSAQGVQKVEKRELITRNQKEIMEERMKQAKEIFRVRLEIMKLLEDY